MSSKILNIIFVVLFDKHCDVSGCFFHSIFSFYIFWENANYHAWTWADEKKVKLFKKVFELVGVIFQIGYVNIHVFYVIG